MLRTHLQLLKCRVMCPKMQVRPSSFKSSQSVHEHEKDIEVEVVRSEELWRHVEALLPKKTVPDVVLKPEYPSTWKPPTPDYSQKPYAVYRTKNNMMPIYLNLTHRGLRRLTVIRNIRGDIWALEKELKAYIEASIGKEITTQVNEMTGVARFRGDYVHLLNDWFLKNTTF